MPTPSPRSPTLLMAVRTGCPTQPSEAEPVLVARTSTEVVLVLDDGQELRFNATELRTATE